MRIYRVHHQDPDLGHLFDWFDTEDKAVQFMAHLEDDVQPYGMEHIEVPMTRLGIVRWLNVHNQAGQVDHEGIFPR